ncbi:protein far1-related sequence 5 [Phtheirospermum japonicum]|uniref:Protein FAR1-RELATED SEQUENCE n=1 Tax=Phtheirospermum japonicum TaxID=374723 RepID=A0A830BQD8_9LAMI|nr:protein far1-related sequence 5 [Phtheirospermum japonicum]
MPFAPFIGVNHHGQSILLGCGLLASEDTDSFIWIFSAWLECMRGKTPIGIITDQDLAMKAAIPQVFPNTIHRWCLWHIMKKLPEKFGGCSDKDVVIEDIKAAVYNSQFPDEFEDAWEELVDKYQLGDLKWCAEMYSERARWVPCYLKTSFWAGMSTIQRSESMNAFFKDFVNWGTSLKQFVEQYGRSMRKNIEKEVKSDHKSLSTSVRCATHFEIEKQFQKAYTNKKFQKQFQKEMISLSYCRIDREENDHPGGDILRI